MAESTARASVNFARRLPCPDQPGSHVDPNTTSTSTDAVLDGDTTSTRLPELQLRSEIDADRQMLPLIAASTSPALYQHSARTSLPSRYQQGPVPMEQMSVRNLVSSAFDDSDDVPTSDLLDQHILLTAHLYGWDYAKSQFELGNRWQKFEELDQVMVTFKDFSFRLATIMVHKVWKFYTTPNYESLEVRRTVPSWMWPLANESSLDYNHPVHTIPWPNIRRYICDGNGSIDVFWGMVYHQSRFAWPNNLAETMEHNPVTGMLQFTGEFRRRIFDLRYWTLESEFFEVFPEFAGEAPKHGPQLAVYRLHDRTAQHERIMRHASTNVRQRAAVQAYYDSLADFQRVLKGSPRRRPGAGRRARERRTE